MFFSPPRSRQLSTDELLDEIKNVQRRVIHSYRSTYPLNEYNLTVFTVHFTSHVHYYRNFFNLIKMKRDSEVEYYHFTNNSDGCTVLNVGKGIGELPKEYSHCRISEIGKQSGKVTLQCTDVLSLESVPLITILSSIPSGNLLQIKTKEHRYLTEYLSKFMITFTVSVLTIVNVVHMTLHLDSFNFLPDFCQLNIHVAELSPSEELALIPQLIELFQPGQFYSLNLIYDGDTFKMSLLNIYNTDCKQNYFQKFL